VNLINLLLVKNLAKGFHICELDEDLLEEIPDFDELDTDSLELDTELE
jgi:hypothetical protein